MTLSRWYSAVVWLFFTVFCIFPAIAGSIDVDALVAEEEALIICVASILLPIAYDYIVAKKDPPRRLGCPTIKRERPTMRYLFDLYGPSLVKRAYRMTEQSFWRLLDILEPHLPEVKKRKRGRTPNGDIYPALRLSMALRYFAGGDPLDIGPLHGVHPNEVLLSVNHVINAVHCAQELSISFPEYHDDQQRIADEFRLKSSIGFWNCVGAIDGILIWTHKPTVMELLLLGFGAKKFFCGRKKKFGVNMQAICDAKRRFVDYEIKHPGATANYLAFTTSSIFGKIHRGSSVHAGQPFIKPGLCLYGDNAYVNAAFMSVPFKGVTGGPKDAYNFYQSSLRINIECAFGMLVHRFGILRKPMPINFSIQKINLLVGCLCKLHNYCINERDDNPAQPTANDIGDITTDGGFSLERFDNNAGDYSYDAIHDRVEPLLDGGEHFDEINRRTVARRAIQNVAPESLPSQQLLRHVTVHGYQRPALNRRR